MSSTISRQQRNALYRVTIDELQAPDPALTQKLMNVLGHELRRHYLKVFVEAGEPLSASRLGAGFCVSLRASSGACRELARCGLIRLDGERAVRGAYERLYLPREAGIEHPLVQAILGATPSQFHIL